MINWAAAFTGPFKILCLLFVDFQIPLLAMQNRANRTFDLVEINIRLETFCIICAEENMDTDITLRNASEIVL